MVFSGGMTGQGSANDGGMSVAGGDYVKDASGKRIGMVIFLDE